MPPLLINSGNVTHDIIINSYNMAINKDVT